MTKYYTLWEIVWMKADTPVLSPVNMFKPMTYDEIREFFDVVGFFGIDTVAFVKPERAWAFIHTDPSALGMHATHLAVRLKLEDFVLVDKNTWEAVESSASKIEASIERIRHKLIQAL